MPQILVFGDSIAYGAWDKEGGWVERLKIFTNKKAITSGLKFYCAVYNLAVDGEYTETLLQHLEFETKQRACGEETIFLFSLGTNDSEFSPKLNNNRIPAENFKENIEALIAVAKKFSNKIIFTGLLPVDESKADPIPWLPEMSYKNECIKKYDKIIKTVCLKNKIHFIDIFKELEKSDYKNLIEDGVHPNSEGHKKIFEIVKDFLSKNKII